MSGLVGVWCAQVSPVKVVWSHLYPVRTLLYLYQRWHTIASIQYSAYIVYVLYCIVLYQIELHCIVLYTG